MVELRFVLAHAETALGQRVLVVGGLAELGGWDPARGLLLETKEGEYPKWSAAVAYDAAGLPGAVEYKYVRDRRTAGGDFVWERAVQNRAAGIEAGMAGMVVELLDGGFDDVADPTVAVRGRME